MLQFQTFTILRMPYVWHSIQQIFIPFLSTALGARKTKLVKGDQLSALWTDLRSSPKPGKWESCPPRACGIGDNACQYFKRAGGEKRKLIASTVTNLCPETEVHFSETFKN